MMENDERKQNLFFPEEMLEEMTAEAVRQGCTLSAIVQKAWVVAREEMSSLSELDGASSNE